MSNNPIQGQSSALGSACEFVQEVRFAVVMYGGVSLAIYINGVAQELLSVVRATAPAGIADPQARRALLVARSSPNDSRQALSGPERVYRKVSYLLSNKEERSEALQEVINRGSGEPDKQGQARREELRKRWLNNAEDALNGRTDAGQPTDDTITTRFVVDIISGTSAGGINGIFLAKALANGQDISRLQELWVEQGDIAVLINDKRSVEKPFALQHPPKSLLNSQRMYIQLLMALKGMEAKSVIEPAPGDQTDKPCRSPYVSELNLFVPTTDIRGLTLPIRLTDNLVNERRYRNVFKFIYSPEGGGRNDFREPYNPFLAYAARCTSSFPFAFEPMSLNDIDAVVAVAEGYKDRDECLSNSKEWHQFFADYIAAKIEFGGRAFGDGGYLDNKPFSYATETLTRRSADVPVQRKLIYVEPSPEHPEDMIDPLGKPSFAENALDALLKLPRCETIREDLQRILDRNQMIARLNRITNDLERDMDKANLPRSGSISATEWAEKDLAGISATQWAEKDLADMFREKGPTYLGYHRLEIASVTDDVAELIARLAGIDTDSDDLTAIRVLARAWRRNNFAEYHTKDKETLNQFLARYNLAYVLRRLRFLRTKIDHLYRLDSSADNIFSRVGLSINDLSESDKKRLRGELLNIKKHVNAVHTSLRVKTRAFRSRRDDQPNALRGAVRAMGIGRKELDLILGKRVEKDDSNGVRSLDELGCKQTVEDCERRAQALLNTPEYAPLRDKLKEVGDLLGKTTSSIRADADLECNELFKEPATAANSDELSAAARRCLGYYYHHFDNYDAILFPITYGTDIGESDVIGVFRVSPEDAIGLINEKRDRVLKLAGTSLGHFGGFLDARWRENDILWGRLDGAERIITALLPDEPDLAGALIDEAQAAIIYETLSTKGEDESDDLLIESFMRTKDRKADKDGLQEFIERIRKKAGLKPTQEKRTTRLNHTPGQTSKRTDAPAAPTLKPSLEQLNERLNSITLRQKYADKYAQNSQPSPQLLLESAARATTVVGMMLGDLSQNNYLNRAAVWVTRVGRVLWGLVEVAVPRTLPYLMTRYALKVLYLFEALLIAGGLLFASPEIQSFGWKALGLTLAAHFTITLLSDVITGRIRTPRLVKWLIALPVLAVVGLSVIEIRSHLKDDICKGLNQIFGDSACLWASSHKRLISLIALGIVGLFILIVSLYKVWKRYRPGLYAPVMREAD